VIVPQSNKEDIEWIKSEMANCLMETAAQGVREYYLYMSRRPKEFQEIDCRIIGINSVKSQFDLEFF
jgi:hypothetical protein